MQNLNTIYRGNFEKIEHLSVRGPFSKSHLCCYLLCVGPKYT